MNRGQNRQAAIIRGPLDACGALSMVYPTETIIRQPSRIGSLGLPQVLRLCGLGCGKPFATLSS